MYVRISFNKIYIIGKYNMMRPMMKDMVKNEKMNRISIKITPPGPNAKKIIQEDEKYLVTSTKSLPIVQKPIPESRNLLASSADSMADPRVPCHSLPPDPFTTRDSSRQCRALNTHLTRILTGIHSTLMDMRSLMSLRTVL